MDEKCRCGSGRYCRKHKAYNLPPAKFEREMRRLALLGCSGKMSRKIVKNTTEVG